MSDLTSATYHPSSISDPLTELGVISLDYLVERLQGYGSEVSQDHRTALQGLMWLASEMTQGRLTGRYRFALPCGMGKSTGVRAFVRTIAALGLPNRVTIACSKVEQLSRLKRHLIDEDSVPAGLIGLVHSYSVNAKLADNDVPGYASEPSEGHDRQFLLVTHARVRVDDQGEARSWIEGRENDLVLYDESLVVGEALTLPLLNEDGNNLVGDSAAFATTVYIKEEHRPAVEWLKSAVDALCRATKGTDSDAVQLVTIPPLTEEQAADYLRLRPLATERWPRLASFIEQARDGVTFRVFIDKNTQRSLVSYTVNVPDSVRNVIVLDASDPVREIVHHDYRMTRAEDVVPCLAKFRNIPGGISSIKRYDNVTIFFAKEGAGRSSMADEFKRGAGSPLLQKFVRLVKNKPSSRLLTFVFKQRDDKDVRYSSILLDTVTKAGVDPYEGITDGSPACRLNVLTWGRETATSDYQTCDVVALLGVLHMRSDVMAGQYLGQLDDINAPGIAGIVQRLIHAECLHMIYQAINRGSMRKTVVIDGVSQAAPCEVYVLHSDPDLRAKIERVLPGARWLPWREPEEDMAASEAALLIADHLRRLQSNGVEHISLKALKAATVPTIPSTTWQHARDEALTIVQWSIEGRSLVHRAQFVDETAAA